MASKRVLGISILGEQRDAFIMKRPERRWSNFRPSVAFALQRTVPLDEFCLIYQPNQPRQEEFCNQAKEDIQTLSRKEFRTCIPVNAYPVEFEDPYDLNECYRVLFEAMNQILASKGEEWEVIANLNTGTHTMHMAIYMIALRFPRPILLQQVQPGEREGADAKSAHTIKATLREVILNPKKDEKERGEEISQRLMVIQTRHPEVKELMHEIASVGMLTSDPILLGGPTGCGKTRIALEIHKLWWEIRKKSPQEIEKGFVSTNCAVFHSSRDLAGSELFGHAKGTFTGAVKERIGLLEEANGGTLFLDEIGDLPLEVQAMLLKAIEEKKFARLGDAKRIRSEFRLICATNRNLEVEVAAGRFREDLFSRLRTFEFRLPGLRDRREDIPTFIDYYLDDWHHSSPKDSSPKPLIGVTFEKKALKLFLDFANLPGTLWRGNLRDLQQSVIRLATYAQVAGHQGPCKITEAMVERVIHLLLQQWGGTLDEDPEGLALSLVKAADQLSWNLSLKDKAERLLQEVVLAECGGVYASAGKKLYAVPGCDLANPTARFKKDYESLRKD